MARIDMHIHSAYSDDGEFSVMELLHKCREARLDYLAIADHNTVQAVPSALALGASMGMQVLAGVELDCVCKGRNLHLLGYHFDHTRPVFAEIEQSILEQEKNAAQQKIALIQRAVAVPLTEEAVLDAAKTGVVTGELIAELLLQREDAGQYPALLPYLPGGGRCDNPYVNFYWDYFAAGKPAYVAIQYISLEDGVSLLHAAGGIAVLAHPGQSLPGEYALVQQVMQMGVEGLEAYSSYHSAAEAAYYARLAAENRWLVTCGSDFHGKTKPAISLCKHGAEAEMPGIIAAVKEILAPTGPASFP